MRNLPSICKRYAVRSAFITLALIVSACQNLEESQQEETKQQRPLPFTKFSVRKVDLLDDTPLAIENPELAPAEKEEEPELLFDRKPGEDKRPSLANKPFHPSNGKIEDGEEPVKLNLNLQAATVEHIVMAFADKEVLNFNYLVDPSVKGAITLNLTDVEMTKKEAWELLEHLLWLSGAYMSESNNFVHVQPFEKMPKEQKLFVTHEKQPNVQAIFKDCKYRKSADVINFIKPFMTDGASATDIMDTNTILLVETPDNVEKLLELIERLDAKGEGNWPVRCFACREIDSDTLTTELTSLLPILGYPVAAAQGPSGGAIKLMSLPRLSAVVVSASLPEVLDEIGKWVKTLDKEDTEDKEEIYYYNVKYSTVDILSQALDAFFTTSTTNGPTANSTNSSRSRSSNSSSSRRSSNNRNTSNTTSTTNTTNNRNNNNRNSNNYNRNRNNTNANGTNSTNTTQSNATLSVFETDVIVFTEEESNRLTIKTTPRVWNTIKAFLQRQDVPPKQVAIQATITEITLSKNLEYGISYAMNKIVRSGDDSFAGAFAGAGTIPGTTTTAGGEGEGGGITAADLSGWSSSGLGLLFRDSKLDPLAFIKAVAGDANTKILSEPQVIARSGATADLQVGSSIPVATESTSYTSSNGNVTSNYEYVETGVILSVTPFITAGNEVRLEINQEVSSAVAQTSAQIAANTPPTIDKKKMSTELVVPDNTTLLMGGMIQTQQRDSNSGIPLLKDIPYIGRIFRSNSQDKVRSELLVLITVNVIDNKQPQEELLRKYKASLEEIESFNKVQEQY